MSVPVSVPVSLSVHPGRLLPSAPTAIQGTAAYKSLRAGVTVVQVPDKVLGVGAYQGSVRRGSRLGYWGLEVWVD